MNKKIVFSIILIILCLNGFVFAADFDIETEAGINSYVSSFGSYNFKVQINSNIDFNGKVVLTVPIRSDNSNGKSSVTYSQNVNLVKGELSEINFEIGNIASKYNRGMSETNVVYSLSHKLEFIDNNKVVYEESFHPEYEVIYNNTVLIGVLTDDIDGLRHLSVSLSNNLDNKQMIVTEIESISNERQLKSVDMIVIDNYNIEKLSNLKINLLKDYVSNGGTILIGTGINDKKILSKFIGVKTSDLEEIGDNSLLLSNHLKRVSIDDSNLESIEKDIFYMFKDKEGKYLITSFSLSDEDFVRDSKPNEFFMKTIYDNNLIGFSKIVNNNTYGNYYYNNNVPMDDLPNIKVFLFGFLIFIILIGPVNYIVLKRIDKLNLLLATILVMSFVFVLVINIVSRDSILIEDYAIVNSIVEIDKGVTTEENSVSIKFKQGNNAIEIPKGDLKIYEVLNESNNPFADIMIEDSSQIVTFNKTMNWEFKEFELNRKISNDYSNIELVFDKDGKATGIFKNTYGVDLYDLKLYFEGEYTHIGDCLIDEEKEIKCNLIQHGSDSIQFDDILHQSERKIEEKLNENNGNYLVGIAYDYDFEGLKVKGEEVIINSTSFIIFPIDTLFVENQEYTINSKDYLSIDYNNNKIDKYDTWIRSDVTFMGELSYKNIEIKNIEIDFQSSNSNDRYQLYIYNYELDDYEEVNRSTIIINSENREKYFENGLMIKLDPSNEFNLQAPKVIITGEAR
jgi:hypothetical protein